jgi:hypothetical protein
MSNQEQANSGLEDLFKQLEEENPNASESELKGLFINAIRKDADLVDEAADWFFDRHYPKLDAARKN